jgi:hypothetical protein
MRYNIRVHLPSGRLFTQRFSTHDLAVIVIGVWVNLDCTIETWVSNG